MITVTAKTKWLYIALFFYVSANKVTCFTLLCATFPPWEFGFRNQDYFPSNSYLSRSPMNIHVNE